MADFDSASPPTPVPARPPPLPRRPPPPLPPLPVQPSLPPEFDPQLSYASPSLNYFRFQAQEAGWVTIASFGTASVWHASRDLLSRQRIVCRMVADPASKDDFQRMDLLVMASEAEWARDLLTRGVPELAAPARPAGGFEVVLPPGPGPPDPTVPASNVSTSFAYASRGPDSPAAPRLLNAAAPPMAAMPVGPLHYVPAAGTSATYWIVLTFLWLLLIGIAVVLFIVAFSARFANF